jgi:hypothetical protein
LLSILAFQADLTRRPRKSMRKPRPFRSAVSQRRQRRGGLTVEMVLVVVVLAIVTVAVVQFGVFYANAQQVALAARVGGIEASETPDLPVAGSVPTNIVDAIRHQLESSNIAFCEIRLEHNILPPGPPPPPPPYVLTTSEPGCTCPPKTPLVSPPLAGAQYVRLTVCVPLDQVFPKQISFFGTQLFDSTKTYEHTTVFRYEL